MRGPSIQFKQVSLKKASKLILDNISFDIKPNTITCIIGENGAGKTSLIKLLVGLERGTGQIMIGEKVISSALIADTISYVPQDIGSYGDLTVRDFVSLSLYANRSIFTRVTTKQRAAVDEALATLRIEDLAESLMRNISGGQRQRASIAMALVEPKPIVVLDEPTSFLDMKTIDDILEIMMKLRRAGKTIIMSLHEINYGTKIADNFLAMKAGRIIQHGSPNEIVTGKNLKELYGIDPEIMIIEGRPVLVDHKKIKRKRAESETV